VKGIIFNLVEGFVVAQGGERAWDSLLDTADLDGGYSSLGDYADEELFALITAYSETHDLTLADTTRAVGRHALLGLAERYPHFFAPHIRTRDMLLTLNDVIHPEVRKLHPSSRPPDFVYTSTDPDDFVMGYSSGRHLCFLAEGMITGAAEHYGEGVTVSQSACMHDGADQCVIHCTFDESRG